MDDYYEPRECECGHREHRGVCNSTITVFYPAGMALPPGVTARPPLPWENPHVQAVTQRCTCSHFYEYEGEQP